MLNCFKRMIYLGCLFGVTLGALAQERHFPLGAQEVYIAQDKAIRVELLQQIAPLVQSSIAKGYYPGAVVWVGHNGKTIYKGVFGNRSIVPVVSPMRADTIFDMASLTKVMATTPAIMQLIERGKLSLDAKVAKYWPAFANHGKGDITVRQLLTHTSGLEADIPAAENIPQTANPAYAWQGSAIALREIEKRKPIATPGSKFIYSDVNFIALAHLVELVSKQPFASYVQAHVFKPLGMKNTYFLPSAKLLSRIAPTEMIRQQMRWGKVHDPLVFAMGGVAGSAGLFSTAKDVSLYAQCLLNGGKISGSNKYLLGPLTILKMSRVQTGANIDNPRGLGWDVDSYFSNRGILFSNISYGHTGWTGTSLWIDPATQTYLIILTSRLHPVPAKQNVLIEDRRTIANIVAASLVDVKTTRLSNTGKGELGRTA